MGKYRKRARNNAQNPRNLKKKGPKEQKLNKKKRKKKGELKALQNGLKNKHSYNLS